MEKIDLLIELVRSVSDVKMEYLEALERITQRNNILPDYLELIEAIKLLVNSDIKINNRIINTLLELKEENIS